MKKTITLTIFILIMCGFAFAQSPLTELEKVKQIKLLESTRESTREDVKRILADYESDDADAESFTSENADIEISYSTGNCSDENSEELWNIPAEKVKYIEISLDDSIKFEDSGFNIANFQKEQKYSNVDDEYIYHNKNFGIAFEVNGNEIETIYLFPSHSYQSLLCKNKAAQEFYATESWFGNTKLEDRDLIIDENSSANVTAVNLSADEITIGCNNPAEQGSCPVGNRKISVNTVAIDPENDVLTYNYIVTGGKITGKGANVIWDLSGVKPGDYTITAGVDDGCGVCGQTKSKTVIVKECPDCKVKQ